MSKFNRDIIYVQNITMPDELLAKLNQEMNEYGLPGVWNLLCFKRRFFFDKSTKVHIDYSALHGEVHSSIVLPIEGCTDTYMYWMDGDYKADKKLIPGASYLGVNWNSPPNVLDSVEIDTEPMITRVDIPHSVTSRKDGSYRTILSIRLQGNPTFEEILQKRFDNKS